MQQGTEDTGLVNLQFGVHSQLTVGPHSLALLGHDGSRFRDAPDDLHVKRQVAGDGGAQVGEVVGDLKHLVVNGDGWGSRSVLAHDLSFLDADGQPELLTGMGELTDQPLKAFFCV